MEQVTKRVIRDVGEETTYEHLCSVELGATAKGEPQIKSVKAYAPTVAEAASQAMTTFMHLSAELHGGQS